MLSSMHGVLIVGVEQDSPASMAFMHLTRGYNSQGVPHANARVVVLVEVVDVVVVVEVEVVEVVVDVVDVVDVVVLVLVVLVVVDVVLVDVVDVFDEVRVEVVVEVVVLVSLGPRESMKMAKQTQITVSFEKL